MILTKLIGLSHTEPPSDPRDCQASAVSNVSISLEWNPPAENGGRSDVQYTVSYQRTDSLHLGYDTAANNLKETGFEITGLNPLTDYKVKVCAENGVSSQSPLTSCCVIDVKTTEGGTSLVLTVILITGTIHS